MKSKATQKKYWEMTTQELGEATKEFDEEFVADTFQPMTEEERARWEKAKRKSSVASSGDLKKISVSVEKTLLARSDGLAKKKGMTRDALIDRALKTVLAADGQKV